MSFSSPPPPPPPPPTPTPTPTPVPTPTPGDYGAALGSLDASDASTSTLEDTLALGDEPVLTEIESGAGQLPSTAFPDGLSDPFSSAQGGWVADPPAVDPFTNTASGSDAYVGDKVDFYTGM